MSARALLLGLGWVLGCTPDSEPTLDAGQSEQMPHRFGIQLDYRFDTVGYFTEERRRLLRWAADAWSERLQDDFVEIPAGTPLAARRFDDLSADAEEVVLDYSIDDLLLFVGCSPELDTMRSNARTLPSALLTSVHGAAFQTALTERWLGANYEPWAITIAFGCEAPFYVDETPETDDDLPNDLQDFLSTAMHEIGHALGIAASQAYRALSSSDGSEFRGERAVQLFGGPVPLEADGHVGAAVLFERQRVLMDSDSAPRERDYPTRLDLALAEDLGYQVVEGFR